MAAPCKTRDALMKDHRMPTSPSKVSIVIPTRERADVLAKCLMTVVTQTYPNLEIIISDNASSPETERVVKSFNDPRIRYFNTGKRISMSHNFEFALEKVTGDWIVCIGDDDGILPGGVARAIALLEKTGQKALASEYCFYNWPSKGVPDLSIVSIPLDRTTRIVNGKDAIRRLIDGTFNYAYMPMIYTGGVVASSVYRDIKSRTGQFYHSQIPDCYSAISVCSILDTYLMTNETFFVSGHSSHGNGQLLMQMKPTPFLTEGNIPFHPDVPLPDIGTLTFSMPALVYECYLQTQHLHNDFLHVEPADQLELILSTTPIGKRVMDEWGRKFAARHKLDYEKSERKARTIKLRRRVAMAVFDFTNFRNRYRIDRSYGLDINDVYEASLVCGTVLATRPNRLRSFQRTFMRRFKTQPSIRPIQVEPSRTAR